MSRRTTTSWGRWVLVLRHHHHRKIINHFDDCQHDGELIFEQLDGSKVKGRVLLSGFSGVELWICKSELPAWKEMIDELQKKKQLRYYTTSHTNSTNLDTASRHCERNDPISRLLPVLTIKS